MGLGGVSWRGDLGFVGEGAGALGGLVSVRSSSTGEIVVCCCHSMMTPSLVGVACSCWTEGGAAPAAAKTGDERPAERPAALKI